jgi:methionyl-tRNA formyltransferase
VIGIVCQPDKPIGRHHQLEKPPTKLLAEQYGIPVFQPSKIRLDPGPLLELDVDYILTLAYGQIVPQSVLDLPKKGAYNLHGSLLPKLRGASPLRYCFVENMTETGVTLMKMVLAMDAGDRLASATLPILPDDTYSTLLKRFTHLTQTFILEQLPLLIEGKLQSIPQNEDEVTFAPLIKKEQEHLPLEASFDTFLGWVRALSDEPGGYLLLEEKKIKLFQVHAKPDANMYPLGTIISIDKHGLIFQGNHVLYTAFEIQIEGKNRQSIQEIANGYRRWVGLKFT